MGPFDEAKCPTSKTVGMASEVTLITPIKKGRVEGKNLKYPEYRTYRQRLEDVLDGIQEREAAGTPTPVSVLRQIHFARWVVFDPPGGGQASLIFTSNFDGEMKHYFRNFALNLTGDIDRVWENCEGYPGARDFDKLWQYVKKHQIKTSTFYNAYRSLTVPQIVKLKELKERFDRLIDRCQVGKGGIAAVPPATLAKELSDLLADMQPEMTPGREPAMPAGGKPPSPRAEIARKQKLAQDDIQVNIIGSPPWKQARYFFLTITDRQAFRDGLRRLIGHRGKALGFHTAEDFAREKPNRHLERPNEGLERATKQLAREKPNQGLERTFNIAFSSSGLERLGLAAEHLAALPLAFREGMAGRAQILGDTGNSAPDKWDGVLGCKDIHAMIAVFTMSDANGAEAYWQELIQASQPDGRGGSLAGCKVVHSERGYRTIDPKGNAVEPFGFRHGISQPEINGTGFNGVPGGEFILGYRDADGNDQIAQGTVSKTVRELCDNGTFMVFRKLEQDVAAFEQFKQKYGDAVASRVVGRRPNGASLALDPSETETALAEDAAGKKNALDDFDYHKDVGGQECPFASHVRRANPRDDLGGKEGMRHRIIRRGIPYEEGDKKGVLFVCFNARIDTQFEFLQSEWLNKGDFLGQFTEVQDPIVGGGGGTFVYPNQPKPVSDIKRFVTVKGGEYFFVPGVKALQQVLRGRFDAASTVPAAAPKDDAFDPAAFDPVVYVKELDAMRLLQERKIDKKEICWAPDKRQTVYYVACQDHVRKILANDTRFTSGQYATKIKDLLEDYDPIAWRRGGEQQGPDRCVLESVLLGMPHNDPEKKERHRILGEALGASSVEEIKMAIGSSVSPIAKQVVEQAVETGRNAGGLDVVKDLGYVLPVERAITYFGFPRPTKISDAYITLYFGRRSIEDVRQLGWLDKFRNSPAAQDPARELLGLVHPIAIFLLIDAYDTPDALEAAKIAVKELLDSLAKAIIEEEERIGSYSGSTASAPDTLLRRMLRCSRNGADPATFRLRVGMILAELIVGSIDTTAKAITNVVDCLLSHPEALERAKAARNDRELTDIILEALRLQPVAPLIVRECPNREALSLLIGDQVCEYQFEAGSRLFLLTGAAMLDPKSVTKPVDLSFGDGSHGCLGREIVLAELREVLRHLVSLKGLRRAAGPEGQKREKLSLPVWLKVRFDP